MTLVIDTNIVFSTLLNPKSFIGEIIMNVQDDFTFVAPSLLMEEIERYTSKIELYSKLNAKEIQSVKTLVLNSIEFISEELISEDNWLSAYELTKNVDEYDTPFIALALELNARLWTGDKKLINGLKLKSNNIAISTDELKALILKL